MTSKEKSKDPSLKNRDWGTRPQKSEAKKHRSNQILKRWTLVFGLAAAIEKFVQAPISFFHGGK